MRTINYKITAHLFVTAACCAAALTLSPIAISATSGAAQAAATNAAQAYPARPIRIVAPNSPGSGADVVTRLVANKLTEAWGRQVVIDNRAGASGAIGTEIVAGAAPDGYTLLMITSQQAIVAAMYEKPSYDLSRDFSGISLLASTPLILVVNPAVPAMSTNDLIALAKAKPGQLNYGSPGTGTTSHLATELFKSLTGTDLVHVPYKGTGPALTDTMAGQVQLAMLVATALIPAIKSGKVRALGITSPKRTSLAPDLPTIAEAVPGYEWGGWYGLAAPRGTPPEIIAKLNAELLKALKTADFQEKLSVLGAEPLGTTPRDFEAYIRAQLQKMRLAIKVSGARPE
jgi:tripartite-type tricarboxylate transporter receptor subunit TctC